MQTQTENQTETARTPPEVAREERGMSRSGWFGAIALVAVFGGVLTNGIVGRLRSNSTLRVETDKLAVPVVSIVTPRRAAPTQEIVLPGNVQPFITSPIFSCTNGYLKAWYFDIGARVKKGQLLAEIETPEVDQQLQPLELSYEVDVWGRVRKTVEAQRGQAQASAADLATVNLSMHAQLALFYFQARSLDAEEHLLNFTVTEYEQALQLTESRFKGGVASEVEVQQAKTQLETTRAQAIDVGVARAQLEHAIATLIGTPAPSFSLGPLPLTTPPPPIPPQLPSELLERRPDIAAAERRMASANAEIGVAKVAYYPTITLGASGGFESGAIGSLVSGPSILWSAGASAVAPLFDAGRRRANLDQARAAYDQTVANYRETVLTGFQQVEDNLAALRILEKEAATQQLAVVASEKSLELSLTRYRGGITSYLEVTTAQSAALVDEVTAVNILGRRMTSAVLLIQALGGGWDSSSLPARPECCGKLTSSATQAVGNDKETSTR